MQNTQPLPNADPELSYGNKVRQAMDYNHPAEEAYRAGKEKRSAAKAAAVQYEQKEYIDGDSKYVVEDREDGPYVIAKQAGEDEPITYGEKGLKIEQVPDEAIDRDVFDTVGGIAKATLEGIEGAGQGVRTGLTSFVMNVARSAVDNPIGEFVLGEEDVQAFSDAVQLAEKTLQEELGTSNFTGEEFGTTGQITAAVGDVAGQYVAPAGGLYKTFRAMKAGPVLAAVLADATVGFAGVSPESENLANLLPEDEGAMTAFRELIATDPEDSDFENRTKNAFEAVVTLGIGEVAARGLIKSIRAGKNAIKNIEIPEKVGKAIDMHIGDFTNSVGSGAKPAAVGVGAGAAIAIPGEADANLAPSQEVVGNYIRDDDTLEAYLAQIAQIESNNDPLAKNPNSSAKGRYQFIDSTGRQYGLHNYKFGTPEYEAAEEKAARKLTEANRKGLASKLGREPTFGELYLAHQQGLGGALKLLSNPNTRAADVVGEDAVRLNGGSSSMTAGEFASKWVSKLDGSGGGEGVEVASLDESQAFQMAGGKADLFKKGIKALDEMTKPDAAVKVSNQLIDKAQPIIKSGEAGEILVNSEVVNRSLEALKKTGSAEGVDFNLSRMETTDQLNNLIDEVSEIYKTPIDKAKGGVETFSDTQAKADMSRRMGFDVEEVLGRQKGEIWPAHKIKAARDIFVSELEKTDDLARAIKGGENTSENMINFRRQLAVVSAVQSQIKGVQTEAARALSQYRMTAKSPMEAQINIGDLIEKTGGIDANQQLVDAYINAIENGAPDAAATFARNAEQITGFDMLYESWINSLLGSPTTHMVNMIGNSLTMAQATVERYAAATYAKVEGAAIKAAGGTPKEGGIGFKEANAFAQGQALAVNDAMVAFAKALRSGEGSDVFGKIDYDTRAITANNVNELPISKTIASKLLKKDELINSNGQLARMIDFVGEYYYRLPGRFLMAEDEFFKTINYRAELNAVAAREGLEAGTTRADEVIGSKEVLADPQMNAPDLHQKALDFSREQTFTTPPGPIASNLRRFLSSAEIGGFPAGRVVVPFFNVINNITKYTMARVPGAGLINPQSKTYQDFFSKDPAKRQLVMGKWATGGSLLGFGAWSSMEGISTGRITDNGKMLKQIEQGQGKKRYSIHIPGTDKMMNYNRLEPAGMLLAIAADTANALAYVDDDEQRSNLVLAATAAVVPYMQDKSFFEGISRFFEAFNPQFGDDDQRTRALGRYVTDLASTLPGAVLGPLAPNTPLNRNIERNGFGERARRITEANKWTIETDDYGDKILVADSESYQLWNRTINKIMSGTIGLSADLPGDVNIWGEDIIYEGGLGPDLITPIYTNTPTYDIDDLKGKNMPPAIEAGRFRGVSVGADMTPQQHRKFVDVVGIDGELERLNMPLSMPRRSITARVNGKTVGLAVDMNPADHIDLIKIMNEVRVPNGAEGSGKRMTLKETLNWLVKQPEYAKLPDDADADGAKGDMIRKVYSDYKGAATELFLREHPNGAAYMRKSLENKIKAQNTGVQ